MLNMDKSCNFRALRAPWCMRRAFADLLLLCVASSQMALDGSEETCRDAMRVRRVVAAGVAHPFGDERTVNQAFPNPIPAEEADPFLMCDQYSKVSDGIARSPDDFPVDWHPHRGMDILSYLKSGIGRHGDSMGNRESFHTPGMQWCSCGSGIEHAEGGGTPAGDRLAGFQIWINVPARLKMRDPKYGTNPPADIPQHELAPAARARLLAGPLGEERGPFTTAAEVSIIDFELGPGARLVHRVPPGLETCLLYVYEGSAAVNGQEAPLQSVVALELLAGPEGLSALLFAGKRLNEPIAWHGPIVMSTQEQLRETFGEMRAGRFPPKRAAWDYKRLADFPKDHPATQSQLGH
jgi:hypothetical protein